MPGEFMAVITDIRLESRVGARSRWQVALDSTGFRAGDTGELEAEARSGARLVASVLGVIADEGGQLWHVIEKPLTEGTRVRGRVTAL